MPKVTLLSPPLWCSWISQRGFGRWVHFTLSVCNMCMTFLEARSSRCVETVLTAPNACFQPICCPAITSVPFPLFPISGAPCAITPHISPSSSHCPALLATNYLPSSHRPCSKTLSLLLFFSLVPCEVAGVTGGKELLLEQSWLTTQTLRSNVWVGEGLSPADLIN